MPFLHILPVFPNKNSAAQVIHRLCIAYFAAIFCLSKAFCFHALKAAARQRA